MSSAFFGGLNSTPFALPAGGAGQEVPLVPGWRYELRCSDVVLVKSGSGADPRPTDLQAAPGAPLTFEADASSMMISAQGASCNAWLREWRPPPGGWNR